MPNIPSAAKRARQNIRLRAANQAVTSTIRNTRRKLFEAFDAGDKAVCEKLYREYTSVLDRAVKKGVILRNQAARRKSRSAHRLAAMA
ncbi:MAG: 30S ribosomal protein S20 [Lentisphaerae bacterium RIFOXYC12_FULL_60_16]|nr:MAG: 30S ribosomal protein S20 [Lentisphaerae bacterium RIFOXYC12_FULL_60_16]OGV85098.1 MAG: 30S ribosomal protein S20 [Lentisphaerae bacterium RIFOXYB12_FULL_60_10]